MTWIGQILPGVFQILCRIWRIPFKFSQILREIRGVPHGSSKIQDVFRQENLVISQDQDRISQILEGISRNIFHYALA